jgi:hypothetical protein
MSKVFLISGTVLLIFLSCKSRTSHDQNRETIEANGKDTTITFEYTLISKLPSGWSSETGVWKGMRDEDNTVLMMEKNDGSDFNIAVLKQSTYQDLEIYVRVKAINGEEDQGGGLVWRYVDRSNYYIARVNPLENNIRLYKVVGGKRKQLESSDIEIRKNEWFQIGVTMQRERIECFYNGVKVFSASDQSFQQPGQIGVWSKADAVSYFDDLKIKSLE